MSRQHFDIDLFLHFRIPVSFTKMTKVQPAAAPAKLQCPSSKKLKRIGVVVASSSPLTDRDIQAGWTLMKMMGLPQHQTNLRLSGCADWLHVRDKAMAKELTIEDLRNHFDKPIAEAAFQFGICTTLLKKICRKLGVQRWPCRQIRSLAKTIQSYELQLEKVVHQPAECAAMQKLIQEFRAKQEAILMDPGKNGKLGLSIRRKAASVKKKSEALDRKRTMSTSSLDSSVSDSRSPPLKHMRLLPVIHEPLELHKVQVRYEEEDGGRTDSEKSLDFKQPEGEPSPSSEGTC